MNSELQPLVHIESFGQSHQRALPLWILADPPVESPHAARASGKPVVSSWPTSTRAR